ncbi:MAG TPA: nitronate monooxygenase [Bryobacteraceae bacterium]|nr:nitronate monooxygenase [Bryobacteraceae bacterium]
MLRTAICDLLDIEHPIFCAPMGFVTGAELAAAVSEAGGFGILQAGLRTPDALRAEIQRIRGATRKPFGVNFIQHFPHQAGVDVCLEERVAAVSFFWGDPRPFVERAHAAGVRVIDQVGSVADARRDADAGVDIVIAQGVEGGGHIAGMISTLALVPRVVDAIAPRPVAAAGAISDSRGIVAVLALGAQAAVLGTRFLASAESDAHPEYKQRIVAARESDTIRTTLFGRDWPDAPHRVLRTPFVERGDVSGSTPVGMLHLGPGPIPILPGAPVPPSRATSGDIASMPLYAGQGAGLVNQVEPVAEIMRKLVAGAEQIVARMALEA